MITEGMDCSSEIEKKKLTKIYNDTVTKVKEEEEEEDSIPNFKKKIDSLSPVDRFLLCNMYKRNKIKGIDDLTQACCEFLFCGHLYLGILSFLVEHKKIAVPEFVDHFESSRKLLSYCNGLADW